MLDVIIKGSVGGIQIIHVCDMCTLIKEEENFRELIILRDV